MQLHSCKKTYNNETQRASPLAETLARIEPKVPAAGITRVADITSLDRIGIPVFSCIRPTAEDGAITVYNGKGATVEESRISAIMEGIERYSAEAHDRVIRTALYQEFEGREPVLNPEELILPEGAVLDRYMSWYQGYDIVNNETLWVPAFAVFHPVPPRHRGVFRTNTNGLASGNTIEEAVFHALSEVIERDAWSLVESTRQTGPAVVGIDDPVINDMQKKFADAQVEVTIRDITSDIGIPTIAAVADDVLLKDPSLLTIGIGTHTSARIAVMRALTEVAQSRLTQIHGAREDTTIADLRKKMGYERAKRINGYWYRDNGTVDYSTITSSDTDDFLKDIQNIITALGEKGLDRVIVVDLTREEIGIPVVRVIVPGLEVFAMDPERRGERVKHAKDHRLSRAKP
ncbi:MAG: YcaO-related McrA-glycine thioamidation protein [Methanoregula sp.]|nr:YcaO-related McrA-glycine thioamidation protein [Methanoregula sp.]